GSVGGAVVDDDDAKILQIGNQNGLHSLNNHTFFVVSGGEYRDAWRRIAERRRIWAHFFNERKDADNYRAPADHHDADDKDGGDAHAEPVPDAKDESVGACFQFLFSGKRHHDLGARFANQIRHGNQFVAFPAERIDDSGQREDGVSAFAAAIVKQHNVTVSHLAQDVLGDLLRRNLFAVDLAPVVSVDFLTDNEVTHILGDGELCDLLRIFRLMIDSVGRTEEDGFRADGAFQQALREIEFPVNLVFLDVVEWRMRVSVIANLMSLGVF